MCQTPIPYGTSGSTAARCLGGARHDAWIVLISINFSDEGRAPADPEGGPAGEVEGEGLTRLIAELILNSVQ